MTSFDNDNGALDYSGEDLADSRQSVSFFDFKMKGDYTVDFKVDNTAHNREVLGYTGPQQTVAPSRQAFNMRRNGNIIKRGYIVIRSSDEKQITLFFLSGNSNWFELLKFNLKDIDFADRYTVLSNDVDGRKAATEGIIYPFIDWWASSSRRATAYMKINGAPSPEEFPVISDVHPCLYLHTIVEQMAIYAGVKINGTLTTDPLYNKIIITGDGPEIYVPDTIIERTYALIQNGPFGSAAAGLYDYTLDPQLIRFNTLVDGQGQVDTTTYSFLAPRTGTYRVDLDFWVNANDTYQVQAFVNGVLYNTMFNQAVSQNKTGTAFLNLSQGDQLQFYVNNTLASNYRLDVLGSNKYTNFSIKLERLGAITPTANLGSYSPVDTASYVIPNEIVPDMDALDLIKFLVMYFCCSITYDEYSKTITINKLTALKREDARDWTPYFVSARTRWDTGVAKNNFIQFMGGPEKEIVSYNEQSDVKYGGGNIEAAFDAAEKRDVYTVPFSPPWEQINKSYSKVFMPYINFYDIEYGQSVSYSGVSNSGGFAQFTCTFNEPILDTDLFYIISTLGVYSGFAPLQSAASATTNPALYIDYVSGDTGTIIKCKATRVKGPHRMLICNPGKSVTEIGGTTIALYLANLLVSTVSTIPVCWFDKPIVNQTIDTYRESLALDAKSRNNGILDRFHTPVKEAYQNPIIEGSFLLPIVEYQTFNFGWIYVETEGVTGYFFVQKIDGYKNPDTVVKVEMYG